MVRSLTLSLAVQFIFLAWSILSSDARINKQSRIFEGKPITIVNSPYQVWLGYRLQNEVSYGHLICGGSVITQRVVLTAASCFDKSWDIPDKVLFYHYIIVAGGNIVDQLDENTQHYRIQQLIRHPNYEKGSYFNNIALVFLNAFIPWNSPTVKAVALPEKGLSPDTICLLSGWGEFEEDDLPYQLHQVHVLPMSYGKCKEYVSDFRISQICSYGDYGCHSDIGGPLVCSNQLYGLVLSGSGCKEPGMYLGAYTNVSFYVDWIRMVNSTLDYNSTFGIRKSFNVHKSCLIALSTFVLGAWIKRL